MRLSELSITAIDFETTGSVKGHADLPWQIGMAAFEQNRAMPAQYLSLYLRVPAEHKFNPYTPGRWAERREELALCNSLAEEWPRVGPWLLGHWLVAHNAPTERKILRHAYPMHRFGPWLDTLKMVRIAYPGLDSYSLGDVLNVLALTSMVEAACPGLAPHNALYDAVGCAILLEHILSLPGWASAEPEDLAKL